HRRPGGGFPSHAAPDPVPGATIPFYETDAAPREHSPDQSEGKDGEGGKRCPPSFLPPTGWKPRNRQTGPPIAPLSRAIGLLPWRTWAGLLFKITIPPVVRSRETTPAYT